MMFDYIVSCRCYFNQNHSNQRECVPFVDIYGLNSASRIININMHLINSYPNSQYSFDKEYICIKITIALKNILQKILGAGLRFNLTLCVRFQQKNQSKLDEIKFKGKTKLKSFQFHYYVVRM